MISLYLFSFFAHFVKFQNPKNSDFRHKTKFFKKITLKHNQLLSQFNCFAKIIENGVTNVEKCSSDRIAQKFPGLRRQKISERCIVCVEVLPCNWMSSSQGPFCFENQHDVELPNYNGFYKKNNQLQSSFFPKFLSKKLKVNDFMKGRIY